MVSLSLFDETPAEPVTVVAVTPPPNPSGESLPGSYHLRVGGRHVCYLHHLTPQARDSFIHAGFSLESVPHPGGG